MPSARRLILGALGGLLLAGCAPKAYVRPGFLDHPPKRVAVLPFRITYPYDLTEAEGIPSSHVVGRDTFRQTFYYALTPLGFEDIKLPEVDAALAATWGPIEEDGWQRATPQELGVALGADALIYGEMSRLMHFSTPLYTETSLTASMRMVDAATGEELWRSRQIKAAERGGALMKKGQVVDFVKDQARSVDPRVKFLRISDAAVRQALKGLPNPPMALDSHASSAAGGSVRLALLPLEPKNKNWRTAAETLRGYLAASLQETPFEVLEVQRVDAALEALGWHEGDPMPETLKIPELAQALGADVVMRGTVTNWGRTYLVVQSWVKAELQVELLDGRTGGAIWADKLKKTRQAGILKGPTGYKSIVTSPITGLKTGNLERVAKHLTRELVQHLDASPAILTYLNEHAL
ncbi:MAG: DUF799 family lipoprotein [Candidatus Omnitrophica bacterium]|nr:DUF799 family lipoprotein [Candidatus Omnitrophota bacterium]